MPLRDAARPTCMNRVIPLLLCALPWAFSVSGAEVPNLEGDTIDEAIYRRLQEDDPSEWEKFKKKIDAGEMKLGPAVPNQAPAAPAREGARPKENTIDAIPATLDAWARSSATALIARLADDEFDRREAAQASLEAMGTPVIRLLREAAAASGDPEVIWRCRRAIPRAEYEGRVAAASSSGDLEKLLSFADSARLARRPSEVRRICRLAREVLEKRTDESDAGRKDRQRWEYRIGDHLTFAYYGPEVQTIDDNGPKFREAVIIFSPPAGAWLPGE